MFSAGLFRRARRNLLVHHARPSLNYDVRKGALPLYTPASLAKHLLHHDAASLALNKYVAGTQFESAPLWSVLINTCFDATHAGIANMAGAHFNHCFFWRSLRPGSVRVGPHIYRALMRDFDSVGKFVNEFSDVALNLHGSGWVWLVYLPEERRMSIMTTVGSDNPVVRQAIPLLALDCWEHAYCDEPYNLDKAKYISAFWGTVDWDFVQENLLRCVVNEGASHFSVGHPPHLTEVEGHPEMGTRGRGGRLPDPRVYTDPRTPVTPGSHPGTGIFYTQQYSPLQ